MRGPALAGPFLFAVDRGLTPICADYTDSMRATTDFRRGRGWKDKGKSEFLGLRMRFFSARWAIKEEDEGVRRG